MRMTNHHTNDLIDAWMGDLRSGVVRDLRPEMVSTVAAEMAKVGVPTTTATALAVAGGGAHMTTAAIGVTAAAHTGLKIAAGCLAAALTAGGAAAATGNLPAGAQRFAANAGFTAKVIAETADAIIVEFRSDDAVSSVLVSDVNRTITAEVTGAASLDTGGNADGTGS